MSDNEHSSLNSHYSSQSSLIRPLLRDMEGDPFISDLNSIGTHSLLPVAWQTQGRKYLPLKAGEDFRPFIPFLTDDAEKAEISHEKSPVLGIWLDKHALDGETLGTEDAPHRLSIDQRKRIEKHAHDLADGLALHYDISADSLQVRVVYPTAHQAAQLGPDAGPLVLVAIDPKHRDLLPDMRTLLRVQHDQDMKREEDPAARHLPNVPYLLKPSAFKRNPFHMPEQIPQLPEHLRREDPVSKKSQALVRISNTDRFQRADAYAAQPTEMDAIADVIRFSTGHVQLLDIKDDWLRLISPNPELYEFDESLKVSELGMHEGTKHIPSHALVVWLDPSYSTRLSKTDAPMNEQEYRSLQHAEVHRMSAGLGNIIGSPVGSIIMTPEDKTLPIPVLIFTDCKFQMEALEQLEPVMDLAARYHADTIRESLYKRGPDTGRSR